MLFRKKVLNIRPTTGVYATYKNIKYDPWTAIAEFVDNSTQSFYDHENELEKTEAWNGLKVEIIYEKNTEQGDRLIIKDNAFGMEFDDFKRAIILDSPPKKATRSEFGMGLKTAACWFGKKWSVESTALNSNVKYKTMVDVDALHEFKNEDIEVEQQECRKQEHGTVITIWDLNRKITGRQIGKTKDQLRGMYRTDLRSGKITIVYDNGNQAEELIYTEPAVLVEQLPDGTEKTWKEEVNFTVENEGKEYRVYGFIGIRETANTSSAGFALIRRGRVIIGGYEDTYRPEEVFEKSNSFVYQRLFGELNMDDWPVTQTKDAFDWYSGLEDAFIDKLNEVCKEYKWKAKTYRKKQKISIDDGIKELVNKYSDAGIIKDVEISSIDEKDIEVSSERSELDTNADGVQTNNDSNRVSDNFEIVGSLGKKIRFTSNGQVYVFNYILSNDDENKKWLNITKKADEFVIEWNIEHPFFKTFMNDQKFVLLMEYFTFGLSLAEIEAMRISTDSKIDANVIRLKMNETLKAVMKGETNE